MSAESVLEVLDALEGAGLTAWLDGGWGVDALVGEQTREHDDLDLVMELGSSERAIVVLGEKDFAMFKDERPCSFVLRDPFDRRVDIHPVLFAEDGGGMQAQPNGIPWRYPPEGFHGEGTVAGRRVRCLTAGVQVECHDGYELDEVDIADMRLLRDRWGVELPSRFDRR